MNIFDLFWKSYSELRTRLEIPVMPVDSSGVEKFTATNPGNTSDTTLQSSAAAILGKIIAAPSTEAKQDALITAIRDIERVAADNGIATSGGNNTLTDSVKNWGVNAFAGSVVIITTGTGAGQLRQIASNTATQLTISPNWTTNPDNTSQYEIRFAGKLASDVTHIGGKAQSAIDIAAKIDAIHAAFITNKNAGVQLSGRNVQEITIFNSIAITDTAKHDSTVINASAMGGRKVVYVLNTLNQKVTITILASSSSGGTSVASLGNKEINASSVGIISPNDITGLADPHFNLYFRAECSVAPTSGALKTVLEGVQA